MQEIQFQTLKKGFKLVECNKCNKKAMVYRCSKTKVYCKCGSQLVRTTAGKSETLHK